jgi:hypothetical protein
MAKSKRAKLNVGDQIKITADFLRSTGQIKGGEGQSRWTVVACLCDYCKSGERVAVNQEAAVQYDDAEWIDAAKAYGFEDGKMRRHFAVENVQKLRELVAEKIPQAGFLKLPLGAKY